MNVKQFSNCTVLLLLMALTVFSACNSGQSAKIANLSEKDQLLLNDKSKKYKTLSVGQFQVHYQAGSYSASQKAALKEELTYALESSLRLLEVPSFEKEVHFVLFPSKAEFDAHLGELPIRHYVNPDYNTGYFVHNEDFRSYFTHNLFQIIAIETWGKPKGIMLAIGGSLLADRRCQDVEYFIDEIGASLVRSENLISYPLMFENFYPALQRKPMVAEIQAAALFQYVKNNFGIEKVRALWTLGLTRLEGIIYLTPREFQTEIFDAWKNYTPTEEVDWENIQKYGC